MRILFVLICLINFVNANNIIKTTDNQDTYNNFDILYLEDVNSNLKIQDILKKEFKKRSNSKFALGYKKGTMWFKFSLKNTTNKDSFIISLNESFYEIANLYYKDEIIIKKENGVFTPIKDRDLKTNYISFDIKIPKNSTRTFLLELKGKYSYFGNITIFEKNSFFSKNLFTINSFYFFIYGVILIIIVFNLFLYLKLREKIYIYYVGYSFFNLIYVINMSGMLVFLDLQYYMYKLHLSAAFMLGFLALFSFEYLNTKYYLKKYDFYLKLIPLPLFILGILLLFSYQPWNKYINNFAGLLCLTLITISIIVYFRGYNKTKYYLFIMIIYLTFAILFTFMIMGVLEYSTVNRYGYLGASLFENIFFSLLLADRYNDLKEENQFYLEKEIEKRTTKIKKSYGKIKKLLDEREMILKEVHHRVKNNFHLIIGLIWFEEQKNNENKELFSNLRNRIKAMSLIHERLYKSDNLSTIAFKPYINSIIQNLNTSYKNGNINFCIDIEDCEINFDDALSLGVIVNEVINNSIKHNSKLDKLNIEITLRKTEDEKKLIIKDNGKGFNLDEEIEGLGLSIIKNFSNKLLSSKYYFSTNDGTEFKLIFKRKKDIE